VRPDAVSLVPKLIGSFDEPFADSSAIPVYLVSQLRRQHVKVVLTGDGGDEFFAGYTSFLDVERFAGPAASLGPLAARYPASLDLLPLPGLREDYLRAISRPSALDRYIEFGTTGTFLRRRVLQPQWRLPWDAALLPRGFRLGHSARLRRLPSPQAMQFEATVKLAGDILVKGRPHVHGSDPSRLRCPLRRSRAGRSGLPDFLTAGRSMVAGGKLILLKAPGANRLPPELLNRPKRRLRHSPAPLVPGAPAQPGLGTI